MTTTIDEVTRRLQRATGAYHASAVLAGELREAGLLTPDDLDDFCSAVLADNRPKSGEPYDTIRKWLLLARKQGAAAQKDIQQAKRELSKENQ